MGSDVLPQCRVGGYYNLKGDYLPGSALFRNATLAY
jgi:hypothetical protein